MKKTYSIFLAVVILLVCFSSCIYSSEEKQEEDIQSVELKIEENTIQFLIEDNIVIALHNTSEERAAIIQQRLENIIQQNEDFEIQDTRMNNVSVIILNETPIITITEEDVKNRSETSQGLAYSWAKNIQEVLNAEFKNPESHYKLMAIRSIRGEFGPLQTWQERGYIKFLDEGGVKKTAWVTQYYPSEGFPRGQGTRWGVGVNERVIAANELPASSWVIILNVGIRQVLDTGANSNDSVARKKGADHWLDLWVPKSGMYGFNTMTTEAVAISPDNSYRWKSGSAPKYRWF